MKLKRKHYFLIILIGLTMTFFLGPKPDYPAYDANIAPVDIPIGQIEAFVADREGKVEGLRQGNEAFFQWADSFPTQTEYAVVFLHGFSASPAAGKPVVTEFARRFGFNLYAARLHDHGLATEESFADLTPADMVNSAKEALAIGKVIGKKTILIGSSTGCTMGAYLAAENPDYVHSMIFFSPNIDLAATTSNMMLWPWGKQILRMVVGKYRTVESLINTPSDDFWTIKYRSEGLMALKFLIVETMKEKIFKKITQPVYVGYYFKDEQNKDETVSIPAMKEFFAQISTPEANKRMEAIAEAGAHVMLSDLQCKDTETVLKRAISFAEEVLGLAQLGKQQTTKLDSLGEESP